MLILRAFLALFCGFAAMAAMVTIATIVLTKFVPEWTGQQGKPTRGYIFVNLGYSLAAAMLGGYVTTWLAQNNPLIHTLALAIIVLLLSGLSALQQRGQQPVWYQLALMILSPAGILAGGLLRLKLIGVLH